MNYKITLFYVFAIDDDSRCLDQMTHGFEKYEDAVKYKERHEISNPYSYPRVMAEIVDNPSE